MLTANNPTAPQNLARFNMKERSYKFEPMVEQHVSRIAGRVLNQHCCQRRRVLWVEGWQQVWLCSAGHAVAQ